MIQLQSWEGLLYLGHNDGSFSASLFSLMTFTFCLVPVRFLIKSKFPAPPAIEAELFHRADKFVSILESEAMCLCLKLVADVSPLVPAEFLCLFFEARLVVGEESDSFCFYHLSLLDEKVRFSCLLPSGLQLSIPIRKSSRSEYGFVPVHHEEGTLSGLLVCPQLFSQADDGGSR